MLQNVVNTYVVQICAIRRITYSCVNLWRVLNVANVTRQCMPNGRWYIHPDRNKTWSNYSACVPNRTLSPLPTVSVSAIFAVIVEQLPVEFMTVLHLNFFYFIFVLFMVLDSVAFCLETSVVSYLQCSSLRVIVVLKRSLANYNKAGQQIIYFHMRRRI